MSRLCARLLLQSRHPRFAGVLAAILVLSAVGATTYGQTTQPDGTGGAAVADPPTVDELMEADDYEAAAALLLEVLERDLKNTDAMLKLASCYLGLANQQLADGLAEESESALVREAGEVFGRVIADMVENGRVQGRADEQVDAFLQLAARILDDARHIRGETTREAGRSPGPSLTLAAQVASRAIEACRGAISVRRSQLESDLAAEVIEQPFDPMFELVGRFLQISRELAGEVRREPGGPVQPTESLSLDIAEMGDEVCRAVMSVVEQRGDIEMAISVRLRIRRLEEDNPLLLRAKARRLAKENATQEAIDAYEAYVKTTDGRTDYARHMRLAELLESTRGYYRAMQLIAPLVDPGKGVLIDNPYAQSQYARLLRASGRSEEALEDALNAIKRALDATDGRIVAESALPEPDPVRLSRLWTEKLQYHAMKAAILTEQATASRDTSFGRDAEHEASDVVDAARRAFDIMPESAVNLQAVVQSYDQQIGAVNNLLQGRDNLDGLMDLLDSMLELSFNRSHYQSLLDYRQALGLLERVRDQSGAGNARWLGTVARMEWTAGRGSALARHCSIVQRAFLERRVIPHYANLGEVCELLVQSRQMIEVARVVALWRGLDPADTAAAALWDNQIPEEARAAIRQEMGGSFAWEDAPAPSE